MSPHILSHIASASQIHQRMSVSKRTRSPPISYADVALGGNYPSEEGTDRESQAKAKRLARFKTELSQPLDDSMLERQNVVGEHSVEATGVSSNGNALSVHEGLESPNIIIGLCPDMCPESERAERERKGDLDQHERVDGDRNQTSKLLAIKKYTRTAERDASLIRPMQVLQETIDYLLSLLDQPYDERFLGIYNFLWDRMRAIRMDLRMQHIFDSGAITMLEQMIRLHIIAMHELCEITKGEGFGEGFDAHLNIEQMNKTSVELFQMYDDHRKNGINIPTESEFRGYYALLKLDRHPGYKVDPAELSLDLAKMTPKMRQSPEIIFARDVARACRTSNFIVFFRLVRKGSYLQSCLMHAHFAKLRTQALASLHSGLQNNQGVPVALLAVWLGMEKENIRSLLVYHGFSIKEFEEPYMVKDGPFLNVDKDFPTRCSKLVHLKRSKRVVDDVSLFCQLVALPAKKELDLRVIGSVERKSSVLTTDEDMADFGSVSPKQERLQVLPTPNPLAVCQQNEDNQQVSGRAFLPPTFSPIVKNIPGSQPAKIESGDKLKLNLENPFRKPPEKDLCSHVKDFPVQIVSNKEAPHDRSQGSQFDYAVASLSSSMNTTAEDIEDRETIDVHQGVDVDESMACKENMESHHAEEVANAKLKLIIRIWRRRILNRRELRQHRHIAANAALDLLSLGPLIQKKKNQPRSFGGFDINHIMRQRCENYRRSWSRLNVSEVIADELSRRNPDAKCLCWKIILCSQINWTDKVRQHSQVNHTEAASWLLSKLIPAIKEDLDYENDLAISSSGLSIWKKWVPAQSTPDLICCLSIVRDANSDSSTETLSGANAILFLVSESIPWELQKIHLHTLLWSLPSGSSVPLLVLTSSCKGSFSDLSSTIVDVLGLCDIEKSQISNFLVVSLVEDQEMENFIRFFSDEQLREGLRWLASQSPLQPVVHHLKTRELVLAHMGSISRELNLMNDHEVSPGHCISAFNEALDQSVEDIVAAASVTPVGWPCPELALLGEFSDERQVVCHNFPTIGWRTGAMVEQLVDVLRDCKLPPFPDDISWLASSPGMGREMEHHRSQLESCLIRYLSQSCGMMGLALATNESRLMLQKGARLELHNIRYNIIPMWIKIFQRIFNWRLMSLGSWASSDVYVLESHSMASSSELEIEGSNSSLYSMVHPSLDEMMVQASCNLESYVKDQSMVEASEPLSRTALLSQEVAGATDAREVGEKRNEVTEVVGRRIQIHSELKDTSRDLIMATEATKGADKLSKLLEQCNIVQSKIDDALSIYF